MDKIFEVYIAPADSPSEAYAELWLPVQPYALFDALDKAHLDDNTPMYLEVNYYAGFAYLAPILSAGCSLLEINALAQKLSELDKRQSEAFEGLVKMEVAKRAGSITMPSLLDLAYSADCCHFIPEVRTDAQLGRFYAENSFIPELDALSDNVFEMLDFEKIGREARLGENGVYTNGGYVLCQSELLSAPLRLTAPPQKPEYIFRFTAENDLCYKGGDYDGQRAVIDLPATEAELNAVLQRLEAPSWDNVILTDYDGAIPDLTEMTDWFDGIERLNELALAVKQVEAMGLLPKFKAVMAATECSDLDIALALTEGLDEYVLDAGISSTRDLAMDELKFIMNAEDAELLAGFTDMHGYGQAIMDRDNVAMTPYGLVTRTDCQPIQAQAQSDHRMEMM